MILKELKTGTTTLGIVCKDGIVLAADQQSTMGYLVSSKSMKKIYEISDKLYMTIAGTAGDGQALARILKAELKLYELQEKKLTIKAATTLLSNILRSSYKSSFRPDMVQLVLGGIDERGPQIYSIDLVGGIEPIEDYSFTGSGSVIALGVLEDNYRKDMSVDEGVKLLVRAIKTAKERDIFTGGRTTDIVIVQKNASRRISEEELKKLLK